MKCAYDGACLGSVRPLWIRSVGIPLCERHLITVQTDRKFETDPSPRSLELLMAAAVAVLSCELAGRESNPAA